MKNEALLEVNRLHISAGEKEILHGVDLTVGRDETHVLMGPNGLKLTIDLKRGADPDKLMQKLFKTTTLQDAFGCNFNILIAGWRMS